MGIWIQFDYCGYSNEDKRVVDAEIYMGSGSIKG